MTEIQIELIIATFEDEDVAADTLKELKTLKSKGAVDFGGAANVWRDEHGRMHIKELGDSGGGRGAAIGGAIGVAIGLLAGPAGVVAGGVTGAWIGAVADASTDTGIPDDTLRAIGAMITSGMSALVVMVEAKWIETVQEFLVDEGGSLIEVNGSEADDTNAEDEETTSVS